MDALAVVHLLAASLLRATFVLAGLALGVLGLILAWVFNFCYIAPIGDKLYNMPGPNAGRFESHMYEMTSPNITPAVYAAYIKRYGLSWRFNGMGSFDLRLMTLDPKALSHILTSPLYEKPLMTRRLMAELIGNGIFGMEGDQHKRMRKIITPAFSPQSLRSITPVFIEKAEQLTRQLEKEAFESKESNYVIDIYTWMGKASLDVIGTAGFGWEFGALERETDGTYKAFRSIFKTVDNTGPKMLLDLRFPWLPRYWADERNRILSECNGFLRNWGKRVIQDEKNILALEGTAHTKKSSDQNLLRLLIKSSLADSDPSTRLSDEELLDQLSTFVFGATDTVATSISWTLNLLSQHQEWQTRLREEVSSIVKGDITQMAEKLDTNVILDHIIRESLRLGPPVHGTIRVATKDDEIPLSTPILKRNGKWEDHISIRKGSYVHVPLEGINTAQHVWGPDAAEFRPERWDNPPQSARTHPGLANLMSFSFGPHACPGYRFALVQTKIFLSILLANFVFHPQGNRISRFSSIVSRPNNSTPTGRVATLPIKISRVVS